MRNFLLAVIMLPYFGFSQITDEFNDGEITSNPVWHGDTESFSVVYPSTSGTGSISVNALADSLVLRSNPYANDAIITTACNMAYGEWNFSVADGSGWSISSTNDYFIILISDDSTIANLTDGTSLNFNGYYIRHDGSNDDSFVLYKQSGTTEEIVLETGFPSITDGTALSEGYSIKVTRNIDGLWTVFIDSVFENTAFTQRGNSVIDNTHSKSVCFGISTNIANASESRVLYFDNLNISKDFNTTVEPPVTQIESLEINSLYTYEESAVEVFRFTITDKASTDNLPSLIRKVCIYNAHPLNGADWVNHLQDVILYYGNYKINTDSVHISNDQIMLFINDEDLRIENGTSKEISMFVYLNTQNIIDGKLQFYIDANEHNWLSNYKGSELAQNFEVDIFSNEFTINVLASKLSFKQVPEIVYINQNFSIQVAATDNNSNIDIDASSTVIINKIQGSGNLTSSESFSKPLLNGSCSWNELQYDVYGQFSIAAEANGFYSDTSSIIKSSTDTTSLIENPEVQIPGGNISSLINDVYSAIPVFKFMLSDQATGDGLSTNITEIQIKNTFPENNANWIDHIGGIKLNSGTDIAFDSLFIGDSTIQLFLIENPIEIEDGKRKEINISVYLQNSTIKDNAILQFKIDHINHGFKTNPFGSNLQTSLPSDITSNFMTIDVEATNLKTLYQPQQIEILKIFELSIAAIDSNNNIDENFSNDATISTFFGAGQLKSESSLTKSFNKGKIQWEDLSYNLANPFSISIQSENFTTIITDTIHAYHNFFNDDFESGNLNNWSNTLHWISTNEEPLNGYYSLKHNLHDSAGVSYITHNYDKIDTISSDISWKMTIKNGNWDPTSTNNFGFYLMSDSPVLNDDSLNAYVVGVNLTGSDDLLKLWKINTGNKFTELLASNFDWNENDMVSIEVRRTARGEWSLSWSKDNQLNQFSTSKSVNDHEIIDAGYGGFLFNFSSSRAGKLWIDDISILKNDIPPYLYSLKVADSINIECTFSKALKKSIAENPNNYKIIASNFQEISILSATLNQEDRKTIYLETTELVTDDYIFIANNLQDSSGLIMNTDTIFFAYIIDPQVNDVVINEIMADPSPEVGLPEYDFIELYNTSNYPVYLNQWILKIGDKTRVLNNDTIAAHNFLILCPSSGISNFEQLGNTDGILSTTDLTNSGKRITLFSETGKLINSVNYSDTWYKDPLKENGGWTLEKIDPLNNCSTLTNWIASNDETGGTPGRINSVHRNNKDTILPYVTTVDVNYNQLSICFSEIIDTTSALEKANYFVNNGINYPDSVFHIETNFTEVFLYFNDSIPAKDTCILQISNMLDLCVNEMTDTNIWFLHYKAKPGDVLINEIMADPEPTVGLPIYDYLELFNKTEYEINLDGWHMNIGDRTRYFELKKLPAGQFLIITSQSAIDSLSGYGETVGLISSIDLTNAGKNIQLFDASDTLINEVCYQTSWYHDIEKENGGWSLELIDPERTCNPDFNWRASVHPMGGSPGSINSVYTENKDTSAPVINATKALNSTSLLIDIDEAITIPTGIFTGNFEVNGFGNPDSLVYNNNDHQLKILFNKDFVPSKEYTLITTNLTDYCGNESGRIETAFTYFLYNEGDIVINELMVDPYPTIDLPEYEFIEIYNNTTVTINLEGWKIKIDDSEKVIPFYLLAPSSYLILCTSKADSSLSLFGETIAISGFPALSNSGDIISLLDSTGQIIDAISYNTDWYHDVDKSNGGWSLERIDPDNLCGSINNWTVSAHYTGGTPGQQNSVYKHNTDRIPPELVSVCVLTDTTLVLEFNEYLFMEKSLLTANFYMQNIGFPSSAHIYENNLYRIILTITNKLQENKPCLLSIENIMDLCQNKSNQIIKEITYSITKPYNIVFTELMFDPDPSVELPEIEYIEIYNRTGISKTLHNWHLYVGNKKIKLPLIEIKANEYMVLTSNSGAFTTNNHASFSQVPNFAALSNTGDILLLINDSSKIMSALEYNKSWHSDVEKSDGGYSLEIIDPDNLSSGKNNWGSTKSPLGGTPGYQNSIYNKNVDQSYPSITKVTVINDTSIQVYFNKAMDSTTLYNPDNYIIEPAGKIPDFIDISEPFYTDVKLAFNARFIKGQWYSLYVNGEISDISGNLVNTGKGTIFALPEKVETRDIIINEVLFNPSANGVDYVELYNNSSKTFDLGKLFLATRDKQWQLKSINEIDKTGNQFFADSFKVLTTKPDLIENHYYVKNSDAFIQMDAFPPLSNDGGIVLLMTEDSLVIDELHYTEDMHNSLLKSFDGVALERIDYNKPTTEKSNWQSAAQSAGFGTPSYQNSQHTNQPVLKESISLHPEVFSPDQDGYNDILFIQYKMDAPGYLANVFIFNAKGRLIKKIVQNELLGTEGIFSWNGVDDKNNKAFVGIYIVFFEIFNLEGKINRIKKVCVLSGKL